MEQQNKKRCENWSSEDKIPVSPEMFHSPKTGSSLEIDLHTLSGDNPKDTNIKEVKVIEDMPKNKENNSKKVSQNGSDQGLQAIINSNIDYKKKQLEMLEEEHKYSIKISQLKLKKLELEIALLENENKSITEETEEID